ncbi:hypothetical protein HDU82_005955 [Entophlyctis luteolus]|nr:hypothetical protein HDU82_005955 [Entophlyctis luteolus]
MNVLVLHYYSTASLAVRAPFSSFVDVDSDNVRLVVISNIVTEQDKERCLDWREVSNVCTNGEVEVAAFEMHTKHTIHCIYTQQEDLVMRAAHLRVLMGITEFPPDDAVTFRDKIAMKERVSSRGFKCPNFARVWSPANVLQFIQRFGYPVVIKPSLGSASAGVVVLRNDDDRNAYLKTGFFSKIDDDGKCMDYSGDMIIESFAAGTMVHVNGYAHNSKIELAWPFKYINTNLSFTNGSAYGNVLIPASTPHHSDLIAAAQQVLLALPCPEHLVFHVELFETVSADGVREFSLCEVAARRPGGSIGNLIQRCEGGAASSTQPPLFQEMEFRLSIGLGLRHNRQNISRYARNDSGFSVGDLMVPLKIGKLVSVPDAKECPVRGVQVVQIAKPGTTYSGFNIAVMNTCVRLIATVEDSENTTETDLEEKLKAAHNWYNAHVQFAEVEK